MGEPWVLAEQEAARAEAKVRYRPVCADCGERICDEWYFRLDGGECLCERCTRLRITFF